MSCYVFSSRIHAVPNPHVHFLFLKFFLTQLRTPTKELAYFIGIQVACERAGPGQAPQNPGESRFY
jgi:hypothetical protein